MTGVNLDEQISTAFKEWNESHVEFGRTRVTFEAACSLHRETGSADPVELRNRLLAMEKTCAAQFAKLARLSEMRSMGAEE